MIVAHRAVDIMAMEIPDREDVVAGLLVRGDAALLSAREKGGKGLIMLDFAATVAAGESCLGRAVLQGPAVYLALEEGRRTIRDRLRARVGDRDLPLFVAFLDGSDDGQTFRLADPEAIQGLLDLIDTYKPVLVVLDVLREAHDGRENESDDMALLLRPIRQIAHDRNVTIVVTHHASKAGGARGSTSIPAAFDSVLTFVREDLDTDAGMRGVLSARGRDLPKVSQRIEFDPVTFRWAPLSGAPMVSQPTNTREQILQVLNGTDDWLTAEAIAERIPGTKLQTVRNKITDMLSEHYRLLLVRGTGAKGDPRQFHGILNRDGIVPVSSGNNPGATGEDGCVHCGAPVAPSQLYCVRHGGVASPAPPGTDKALGLADLAPDERGDVEDIAAELRQGGAEAVAWWRADLARRNGEVSKRDRQLVELAIRLAGEEAA